MRRLTLALSFVVLLCSLAPAGAEAKLYVGMGDQKFQMFTNPHFGALNITRARLILPYDVMSRRGGLAYQGMVQWMSHARSQRVEPLIAFGHSDVRPRHLPSPREYRRAFLRFRRAYPWARTISVWNEANHASQPTAGRPRRAAQFYNVVRRSCRGCTIVALDVLDQPDMARYVRAFRRHANGRPRIWGLHNYGDAQRPVRSLRRTMTAKYLRLVGRRSRVWFTETGGIVYFRTSAGRVAWPYDDARATGAVARVFKLASISSRVDRVYFYHWQAQWWGNANWDSGFLAPSGAPRPAYGYLARKLKRLRPIVRVSKRRRGRRVTVRVYTHVGARGHAQLSVRGPRGQLRRVGGRGHGNYRSFTYWMARRGRYRFSASFDGTRGWLDQRTRSFAYRR